MTAGKGHTPVDHLTRKLFGGGAKTVVHRPDKAFQRRPCFLNQQWRDVIGINLWWRFGGGTQSKLHDRDGIKPARCFGADQDLRVQFSELQFLWITRHVFVFDVFCMAQVSGRRIVFVRSVRYAAPQL